LLLSLSGVVFGLRFLFSWWGLWGDRPSSSSQNALRWRYNQFNGSGRCTVLV
jgi:hypothetical protein